MDDAAFDHLAQRVDRQISRRATLGGFVGVWLGVGLLGRSGGVSAKKKKKCAGVTVPDLCTNGAPVCGKFGKAQDKCFCLTSVDGVTTCTSVFIDSVKQTSDCQSDADCVGFRGPHTAMVCVHAPCFGHGLQNWCVNQGCVTPPDAPLSAKNRSAV